MPSPLKHITAKQLASFLPTYTGSKLNSFPKLPLYFSIKQQNQNSYLTREFLYSDFKQAFPQYSLFAKSCAQLSYYPEMFNVYNKIIVKCYTQKEGKKFITTKDLFMAFLMNELEGNQQNVAYSRAIDVFPVVKEE